MTQALYLPSRPGVFGDAERTVAAKAAGLRQALARYIEYRRTLSELRALSLRQREDIGFAGLDMTDVARSAMRVD